MVEMWSWGLPNRIAASHPRAGLRGAGLVRNLASIPTFSHLTRAKPMNITRGVNSFLSLKTSSYNRFYNLSTLGGMSNLEALKSTKCFDFHDPAQPHPTGMRITDFKLTPPTNVGDWRGVAKGLGIDGPFLV